MSSVLSNIFDAKRILVCVGSGGVGKTTTAAALGLRAALSGYKTLVLTIDPAKRLANSLGLENLGHEVQQVDPDLIARAGLLMQAPNAGGGTLHAMMLDQKRAFDELVEQHASNPQAAKRIFSNPVYQQISSTLAGSQEYAAIAKLHDFDESGEFEVIVVDTPPTSHALDFLDAPEKLTRAIDSPAIDWFRKIATGGGGGWSMVGRTGSYVLGRLSKFVGSQFINDLAVFFTEFNDILGGFRQRAEQTFTTLRQDKVGFLLVASPEPMAVQEAKFFYQRLEAGDLPFSAFIINRVHQDLPLGVAAGEISDLVASDPDVAALNLQPGSLRIASEALLESHQRIQSLAAADALSIEELRQLSPHIAVIPFLDHDVHDLDTLAVLSDYAFGVR